MIKPWGWKDGRCGGKQSIVELRVGVWWRARARAVTMAQMLKDNNGGDDDGDEDNGEDGDCVCDEEEGGGVGVGR